MKAYEVTGTEMTYLRPARSNWKDYLAVAILSLTIAAVAADVALNLITN
jgi:hypothetical protein